MNWKRICTSIICLLVVCCLLFNMSPIRAQATGMGVALIAVGAAAVVGTVMIGLGVMPQANPTAFDRLVDDCVDDLAADGVYVLDGTVNVARVITGQKLEYGVAQGLVEAVRSWLFSSNTLQTVTAVTGSTIAASTVVGPVSSWAMNRSLNSLRASSPSNLLQLFSLLGLYENVFIHSQDETYLYGFFFDPNGILCSAAFVNPLGAVHSSLFGTYDVLDVDLDYSIEIQQVHLVGQSYISTFKYDIPVFYNASCLLGYSGSSTLEAACFDWSRNPVEHTATTGSHYTDFYFFKKASTDSVLATVANPYGFSNYLEGTYCIGDFTWDTITDTSITTSAAVSLGHVADEEDSLAIGYPLWSSGVITVPGTSTGEEEGEGSDVYYPYFPNFDSNNFKDLSQTEVWEGSESTSDSTTETPDNTGLLSQILSAIKAIPAAFADWFARIVIAVESIPSFIAAIPQAFSDWFDSVISGLEAISAWIAAIPDAFADWFAQVIAGIQAIPEAFAGWFDSVIGGIALVLQWLLDFVDVLQNFLREVVWGIGDILESAFVPDADLMAERVEALRAKFDWIDPFISMAESLRGEIFSGEPPLIYVHLGNAEGNYNWGGTVVFLDLSWYSRYKPAGDAIISGFLWAMFVWRMYLKLPGIINGTSGTVGRFLKEE